MLLAVYQGGLALNYLFFDLECANTFDNIGKICEFGYVLTDENLNVIRHGIHLINPVDKFDWYVKDKILSRPTRDYMGAPTYPKIYKEHIQELLEAPDTVYVGHGVKNDVKFLNDEAERYDLPRFESDYVDAALIHKSFYNLDNIRSIKKIITEELKIKGEKKLHNSEYDARMTLEYVKRMCKESNLSFEQLIKAHTRITKKAAQTV